MSKKARSIERFLPGRYSLAEKNLCFKCGDKYLPGHTSKMEQLNMIVMEEGEDNVESVDECMEQDEHTDSLGKKVEVSLCALSDMIHRKTIQLEGYLKEEKVMILVDTGSSSSFVHYKTAQKLELYCVPTETLIATLADGSRVMSVGICPKVKWRVQNYHFIYSLRTTELGR